ncbi:MAG: SPASM domain-containing protein [Deltaproteobacteria bacterium]|nr:SPASM domain-containing protein [Deltaproteobacteria bacterium]
MSKIPEPVKYIGKKYILNLIKRKRLAAPPFPPELWIENTNHCNARCVMCPRDLHTRPLGIMKLSLFTRLMSEASAHAAKIKRVHLHNYGEPLLDKDLPERIRLAKRAGIKEVYFVTNASLLTPEKSKEIIEAGLDEFKISFYGTDRETYNATMRELDFDRSIQNVRDFFSVRRKLKARRPGVIIQYLVQPLNMAKTGEFLAIFKPLVNKELGDSLSICHLHNFGGGRDYRKTARISGICNYPWRTIVILHDGRVVTCCLDYNGLQVMGDVNKQTIEEIWNGDAYQKARESFKRLDYGGYPVCLKCDIIR